MTTLLTLIGLLAPKAAAAQIQPCVWPNPCAKPELVQIQPCVWPNPCELPTQTKA